MDKSTEESLEKELAKIFFEKTEELKKKIEARKNVIRKENPAYYELLGLMGYDKKEAEKIDIYHNTGRFIFNNAGRLLEDLTTTALAHTKGGNSANIRNPNPPPNKFNIDWIVEDEKRAYEIKWRDATTDGDHVRKETAKITAIEKKDLKPILVMYYRPDRKQAKSICGRVSELYRKKGEAYIGSDAWNHIQNYTGFDLREFMFKKLEDLKGLKKT